MRRTAALLSLVGMYLLAAAPRPSTAAAPPTPSAGAEGAATDPGPSLDTDAAGKEAAPGAAYDPELHRLLLTIQKAGLSDARTADVAQLEELLAAAQARYVLGDDFGSAALLFEAARAPRFAHLQDMPVFSAVHYHLGVALESYGATGLARRAFDRVLARGPGDAYFGPALRRRVDVALARRDYARARAEIEALVSAPGKPALAEHDADELDYLRAREAIDAGDLPEALAALSAVSDASRFSTAAAYLEGVLHARRKDFAKAEEAFCRVVEAGKQSPAAYLVDRRYFPVRDLAQLGLGRIAHEERRHLHAFYHYLQVPEDSTYVAPALFESAWTLAEQGEYALARQFIDELRTRFPRSPKAVEARLLSAMLTLHDCDFREAEAEFTRLLDDLAPVLDHVDALRSDPVRLRSLHAELTRLRHGDPPRAGDLDAHLLILGMVAGDPVYTRLAEEADAMLRTAEFMGRLDATVRDALGRLQGSPTAAAFDPHVALSDAVARAHRLEAAAAELDRALRVARARGAPADLVEAEAQRAKALRKRAKALRSRAVSQFVEIGPVGVADTKDVAAALAAERRRLARLRGEAYRSAIRVDAEAVTVLRARLSGIRDEVDAILGEARMGRIDAVLGAKKKLEIEVRDMAAGRFPPELFGTLELTGLVGNDEEYWPYEGETWPDEYEVER